MNLILKLELLVTCVLFLQACAMKDDFFGKSAYEIPPSLSTKESAYKAPKSIITPTIPLMNLSSGGSFSCASKDTRVICWGDVTSISTSVDTTVNFDFPSEVTALAAGKEHVCAVSDKELYCWGKNQSGQLGLGHLNDTYSPEKVTTTTAPVEVSAGERHTCFGDALGVPYCFGYNAHGTVGVPASFAVLTPRLTNNLHVSTFGLTLGADHTCAIQNEMGYCWGEGNSMQRGDGAYAATGGAKRIGSFAQPLSVFKQVAAGDFHGCAIARPEVTKTDDSTERVYCWGKNNQSQVGLAPGGNVAFPNELSFPDSVSNLSLGEQHSCAVTQGEVFCWGDNSAGQLGTTGVGNSASPSKVNGVSDIEKLVSGKRHLCAMTHDQEIYCWGQNSSGQVSPNVTSTVVTAPQKLNLAW